MKAPKKPIAKVATNVEYTYEGLFAQIRDDMNKLFEMAQDNPAIEENFYNYYTLLVTQASEQGDLAAQDYLSYLFRKGLGDLIPVNFELYMGWGLMAGANGNPFAINKLKIFFTRSYDEVYSIQNFEEVLQKNDIEDEYVDLSLGKLFCDAMLDELGITIESLVKAKVVYLPSSILLSQKYEKARQQSIKRVIEYLTNSLDAGEITTQPKAKPEPKVNPKQ